MPFWGSPALANSNAALVPAGVEAPGFGMFGQCKGNWGRQVTMKLQFTQQCWLLVSQGRSLVLGGGGRALVPLVEAAVWVCCDDGCC